MKFLNQLFPKLEQFFTYSNFIPLLPDRRRHVALHLQHLLAPLPAEDEGERVAARAPLPPQAALEGLHQPARRPCAATQWNGRRRSKRRRVVDFG